MTKHQEAKSQDEILKNQYVRQESFNIWTFGGVGTFNINGPYKKKTSTYITLNKHFIWDP